MRSSVSCVLAGAVGILLVSTSALAHHGAASLYDMKAETTMKATITEFVWTNPHVEIGIAPVDGKGDRWLRGLLTESAHAAGRTNTYLGSQYHRLAARLGKKKAAVAVGHSILVIAYYLLQDKRPYEDLGFRYFDQRDATKLRYRLVHRLEGLGYRVDLQPA